MDQHRPEIKRKIRRNLEGVMEIVYFHDITEIALESYDKDGNLFFFSGHIPDGQVNEYYHSGLIKQVFHYYKNRPHGKNTVFYPQGELWCEQYFSDGLLEGTSKTYYRTGTLWDESFYQGGRLHGKKVVYFDNGNIEIISHFNHGVADGEFQRFCMYGLPREICFYRNGMLHGIRKAFDENGEIAAFEIYESGVLTEENKYDIGDRGII